ncbi:unnamed protein product [Paramecium octaurelia]|uniref:Transmembrane protein n=1 Tax=Paramecium octaurelia TaxID=43137 RepID=A0A8S1Y6S1_PAROT|nr:unnamed protein product [Paramecium octaurelia]
MNRFAHKYFNNTILVQIVQLLIIMKTLLYQVVQIRLLSFGRNKMNGLVDQQQQTIRFRLIFIDQLILVIEHSEQYKQWMAIQTIQVDCVGLRLCFINNNLFTFRTFKANLMYKLKFQNQISESDNNKMRYQVYKVTKIYIILKLYLDKEQLTKTKHIAVNQSEQGFIFFPQQYIKSNDSHLSNAISISLSKLFKLVVICYLGT